MKETTGLIKNQVSSEPKKKTSLIWQYEPAVKKSQAFTKTKVTKAESNILSEFYQKEIL